MSEVVATSAQVPLLPHGGGVRTGQRFTISVRRHSQSADELRCIADKFVRYLSVRRGAMSKRDRFIAELRQEAKARKLAFKVETWRGKGGHAMVFVGNKVTTLPSREIDPKTARKIRRALGLD
ncbi:MAG TPA: hypothetical protein VH913_02745 [Hyphomicrobiaceae bacterium]